jgi:outer membrane protein OmpA-like peptidoglycan-associated protein
MVKDMNARHFLLGAAATFSLLASGAQASAIDGWYIGLEGGGNWIDDVDAVTVFDDNDPGATTFEFESGWAALATVGYGVGGFRFELEGGYRANETGSNDASLNEWSVMANALYDIQLSNRISLTLGAGAGGDFAMLELPLNGFDDDQWAFAYQGIGGVSYAISRRLDLFVNYRYLRVLEPSFETFATDGPESGLLALDLDDVGKHTATMGLRYAFGAEAPPPPPPPPPAPPPLPPEPEIPREFIVFFGHNETTLSPEALEVVRQAAEAAKTLGAATLTLVGHADRSGSDEYNEALSLKRAVSVKSALVQEGVAENTISASGKGEGDPLVPTADGVREPQNRRVHISM